MAPESKPDYAKPAYWQGIKENYDSEFMVVELGGRQTAKQRGILLTSITVVGAIIIFAYLFRLT